MQNMNCGCNETGPNRHEYDKIFAVLACCFSWLPLCVPNTHVLYRFVAHNYHSVWCMAAFVRHKPLTSHRQASR